MLKQQITRSRDPRRNINRLESPLRFERELKFGWALGHVDGSKLRLLTAMAESFRTVHKDSTKSGKRLRAVRRW